MFPQETNYKTVRDKYQENQTDEKVSRNVRNKNIIKLNLNKVEENQRYSGGYQTGKTYPPISFDY